LAENDAKIAVEPEIVIEERPEVFPFFIRDDFLSVAEASFFHILKNISGENVLVCPKVSLAASFMLLTQTSTCLTTIKYIASM
jgi:hypothetical protein